MRMLRFFSMRIVPHHILRNRGEYEGLLEINGRLVADLTQAAEAVMEAV